MFESGRSAQMLFMFYAIWRLVRANSQICTLRVCVDITVGDRSLLELTGDRHQASPSGLPLKTKGFTIVF